MSRPFPDDPFLNGAWEPWPMEGTAHDLPVEGEIPRDLCGSLYRNGPNPQYAPRDSYHPFAGDGMIHAFHIGDGRVDYVNRFVRTPRFELERDAGESLFASFTNVGGSDPRTEDVLGGPANTNVVWHAGRLLALAEVGLPPVELDPDTLETRGIMDFDGQLVGPAGQGADSFTAHPKIDPKSGEMLAFGYSVLSPELTYNVISPDGSLDRRERIELPFASMVHDFATTRERVIFPVFPATWRPERVAEGRSILGWEPDQGTHIGVMPRDGGNDDVVWLRTSPCYAFHPLNAHDDGNRVIVELARYPRLPIPADGNVMDPLSDVHATLARWILDLDAGTVKEEIIDDTPMEFPRLDERFSGLDYRYGFAAGSEDIVNGFRALFRYDVKTGRREEHVLRDGSAVSEPIFAPRTQDAPEGQGYLLSVVYRADERRSDLLILDAENVAGDPVAVVKLPHRVPSGFHGSWRTRT